MKSLVPFDEFAPFNTDFYRPRGQIEPDRTITVGAEISSSNLLADDFRARISEENYFGKSTI